MTSQKEKETMLPKGEQESEPKKDNTTEFTIEGYAFHNNIIGVLLRRGDGKQTPDLVLRSMVRFGEIQSSSLSEFARLRDTTSGEEDKTLPADDGSPAHMFLSINVHQFDSAEQAHSAVLQLCEELYSVRNCFSS